MDLRINFIPYNNILRGSQPIRLDSWLGLYQW